jgi:hypothetical protein
MKGILSVKGIAIYCLTASLLLFLGCSPSEPSVDGAVYVDGQPLARGSISFVPLSDKGGPGGGATIVEGTYHIEKGLRVGKYRIEIQGVREVPGKKMHAQFGGFANREVPVVPAKYNTESILIREVRAGANTIDLKDLEGIKKGS